MKDLLFEIFKLVFLLVAFAYFIASIIGNLTP